MDLENAKPTSLNDTDKYKLLGLAKGTGQRGIVAAIIANSRIGKWTRYSDLAHIPHVTKRMAEIIDSGKFRIIKRAVKDYDANGNLHDFKEFCIQ